MTPRSVLNLSDVMDRVGDDRDLLLELVKLFFIDYDERHPELALAIRAKDPQKITKIAHSMKGALGNLSAERGYDAALTLEFIGRDSKLAEAEDGFRRLEAEVEAFRKECVSILGIEV